MRQLSLTKNSPLIGQTSIKDLGDKLQALLKIVCEELKLKVPTKKDTTFLSITRMLAEKYKHFSLAEVKEAFKLNLYGDLDPFFYKAKNGKPENEAYGEMSAKFFSIVLNAYSRYQQHIRTRPGANIAGLLPQTVYTPKEIDEIHTNYRKEICEWFEKDFPEKPFPFITSEYNYKIFLELGLVPEWGLTQLVHKQKSDRRKLSRKEEIKPIGAKMSGGGMIYQYGYLIDEACTKLKKQKKSLREIMSKHYGKEI